MPVEFQYDRDKKVLRGAMKSPMTLEEFAAALEQITQSDQFPPNIRTLWDVRELDFSTLDSSFQERLIDIQKKYPDRGRAHMALVVADDHAFGMSRMYEALADDLPQHVRVFRSYANAENWLLQQ